MDLHLLDSNNPLPGDRASHAFNEVFDSATKTLSDKAYWIAGGLAAVAAVCALKKAYVPSLLLASTSLFAAGAEYFGDTKNDAGMNGQPEHNNGGRDNSARNSKPNDRSASPQLGAGNDTNIAPPPQPATDNQYVQNQPRTGMLAPVTDSPGQFIGSGARAYMNRSNYTGGAGDQQMTPMQAYNRRIAPDSNAPVLHGNPNQTPPGYPGGIGPDARQVRRVTQPAGPGPDFMSQLFLHIYNSRSNENWLPANLPLREVDPEAKPQIAKWHLLSDSDLYAKDPSFGNRDLKPIADSIGTPGSSKNPGHMYAFGFDKNGLPIDVLEYYRDTHNNINYYRQYLINYSKAKNGDTVVNVADYMASNQTQNYGPQTNIAGIPHTLMGMTRYYEAPDNSCLRAERYSANNLKTPMYAADFDRNHRSAGTLSPQFYFYDLFGP